MKPVEYLPIFEAAVTDVGEAARTLGAIVHLLPLLESKTFARHEIIAVHAGLSVRTVRRHLASLVEAGWLIDHSRSSVGRGRRTNTYELAIRKRDLLKKSHLRFPLVARESVSEWSQVLVLSYLVWKCDQHDTTKLTDRTYGKGYSHLARRLSLTHRQAELAVKSLVAGGYFFYSPGDALVILPPVGTGWRSEEVHVCGSANGAEGCTSVAGGVHVCGSAGCTSVATEVHVCGSRIYNKPDYSKPTYEKPQRAKPRRHGLPSASHEGEVMATTAFAERFVAEVASFTDFHNIYDDEIATIIVALVLGVFEGNSTLAKFCPDDHEYDSASAHRFQKFREKFVNDVFGSKKRHVKSPIGILMKSLRTYDLANGTCVRRTIQSYRERARMYVENVRKLCAESEGVFFHHFRVCRYCRTEFVDKKESGAWTLIDAMGSPTCPGCLSQQRTGGEVRRGQSEEYLIPND